MKTQAERVLEAARSFRGVTQTDFLLPDVVDGGPPITRLAARLHELDAKGHSFECLGRRNKCKVWRLVGVGDSSGPAPPGPDREPIAPSSAAISSTEAIPLSNGGVVVVDMCDAYLRAWSWYRSKEGYAMRSSRKHGTVYLHRVVLGLANGDGNEVDHKDCDPLNCRRGNLRLVTHAQNGQNKRSVPGSSSRYRGVTWSKRERRWVASSKLEGRFYSLGLFDDEIEAGRSAEAFRRRHMPYAVPDPALDPVPPCRCSRCKADAASEVAEPESLFEVGKPEMPHWKAA